VLEKVLVSVYECLKHPPLLDDSSVREKFAKVVTQVSCVYFLPFSHAVRR
jgi:hypothetical protein